MLKYINYVITRRITLIGKLYTKSQKAKYRDHNIAIRHTLKLIIRTNASKDLEISVHFCVF